MSVILNGIEFEDIGSASAYNDCAKLFGEHSLINKEFNELEEEMSLEEEYDSLMLEADLEEEFSSGESLKEQDKHLFSGFFYETEEAELSF